MKTLPVLQPDSARTARTLTRCHQVLARRRLELTRDHGRNGGIAERALVAGLGATYFLSIVTNVLRMLYRG